MRKIPSITRGPSAALAFLLLVAVSPGCGKTSPQIDLAKDFYKCVDSMDREKAAGILKIESFYPVYNGEILDREKTKKVNEAFRDALIGSILKKDKAFWGSVKRSEPEAAQGDGNSARTRISAEDGSRESTIFFERTADGKWMIVGVGYMVKSQDNQMVVY